MSSPKRLLEPSSIESPSKRNRITPPPTSPNARKVPLPPSLTRSTSYRGRGFRSPTPEAFSGSGPHSPLSQATLSQVLDPNVSSQAHKFPIPDAVGGQNNVKNVIEICSDNEVDCLADVVLTQRHVSFVKDGVQYGSDDSDDEQDDDHTEDGRILPAELTEGNTVPTFPLRSIITENLEESDGIRLSPGMTIQEGKDVSIFKLCIAKLEYLSALNGTVYQASRLQEVYRRRIYLECPERRAKADTEIEVGLSGVVKAASQEHSRHVKSLMEMIGRIEQNEGACKRQILGEIKPNTTLEVDDVHRTEVLGSGNNILMKLKELKDEIAQS